MAAFFQAGPAAANSTTTATTTHIPVTKLHPNTTTGSVLSTTSMVPPAGSPSGLQQKEVVTIAWFLSIDQPALSKSSRRSDLIGGTARWRLAASQQSGAGPQQTAASYAPMGGARQMNGANGLDTPGPDRLDWERQFFDDTEATVSVFEFLNIGFLCGEIVML
ncbi:unnamed protein product [Strongylus vulgaris]|uniref:Uncharacterized protein n=1 Tax=Strongylus vulgaris TaxID=40348 RepID=A0A3P7INP6_STRVU|nr:unnamed protein product [Strongylus vulgaris]